MNNVQYKSYVIIANPKKLIDSGNWTIHVVISKNRDSGVTEKTFTAANTFRTREEAIEHCINFGRQIIDGESDTCTVDNL